MAGKIKARVCFASLICTLMALLTSCDFRLMSKREVDTELEYELNYTYPISHHPNTLHRARLAG